MPAGYYQYYICIQYRILTLALLDTLHWTAAGLGMECKQVISNITYICIQYRSLTLVHIGTLERTAAGLGMECQQVISNITYVFSIVV